MTLNNVHCLEWSHFYCCTYLTTWKIDLPTSPGVLLRNLGKILLDGSKALQAAQKRALNDENEFVHESIRTYRGTCLHCLRVLRFVLRTYMDKRLRVFHTRAIVVHTQVAREQKLCEARASIRK